MNKYEAMIIVKPELPEEEKKTLFNQISEAVVKVKGTVATAAVWSERRKMCFPIKKLQEGIYYLVNFSAPTSAIPELNNIYKLNENILRVLIIRLEQKEG